MTKEKYFYFSFPPVSYQWFPLDEPRQKKTDFGTWKFSPNCQLSSRTTRKKRKEWILESKNPQSVQLPKTESKDKLSIEKAQLNWYLTSQQQQQSLENSGIVSSKYWGKISTIVYIVKENVILKVRISELKTSMRYNLIPVKMAIIKKSTNNKCWRGYEEHGILSYTVGRNVNWCSHYGEQYGGSLKN